MKFISNLSLQKSVILFFNSFFNFNRIKLNFINKLILKAKPPIKFYNKQKYLN